MAINIWFRRLCTYIIGVVIFLLQPCETTLKVYLNRTTATLTTGSTIDGFSFSFQTCSSGELLKELNNNLTVVIVPGNRTKHSYLSLSWADGNTLQVVDLAQYFSIDSNVVMKVELILNSNTANFSITIMDLIPPKIYSISTTKLKNLKLTNKFRLGSTSFTGCFDGGKNINIDSFASTCPLDRLKPCNTTKCPDGFTGRYCDINIDECAMNKCFSYSTCVDLINGFKCMCGKQWEGSLCDKFKGDLCMPNPCKNNGLCKLIDGKNNYTCTCRTNYVGKDCETFIDPCTNSPCKNGGVCSPVGNSSLPTKYSCKCPKDFGGIHCELKGDPCGSYPCNKGKCTAFTNGTYTCNCSNTGLYGNRCQNNINECLQNPCLNNATCVDKWGSYSCNCAAGFTGTQCNVNIDECAIKPCENGGTCTDGVNTYTCKCASGFTGNQCQTNIDECAKGLCNSSHTTRCEDRINDYFCVCKTGYSGKNCETDINECSPNPCKNGATCVDLTAQYQCICPKGFSGQNCQTNIDDCVGRCLNGATCTDGIDDYTCKCVPGFSGKDCEVNIDDCSPNPCKNYGTCVDGVNTYTCKCIPSYTGTTCATYQDPCKPTNPCKNSMPCLDDPKKGFKCNCSAEYTGDHCEHKYGPCYPSPCNNGVCSVSGSSSYKCTCSKGYEGVNCSVDINECSSNPCFNNGVCVDGIGTYKCNCPIDYLQPNCKNFIYMCPQYKANNKEDYCKNGKCNELGKLEINCTCNLGYAGKRCQTDIDDCAFGYCKNHVKCTDLVNDYSCTCKPGYTNKNCSLEIDECAPRPCKNHATCVDKINDYKCQCKLGYEGRNCELDIDWCKRLSPCQNSGRCTDGIETYNCSCVPGFSGRNCSTDINECVSNPCVYKMNAKVYESVCVEKSNITGMKHYNFSVNTSNFKNRDGYKCVCLPGLSGTNCTTNLQNCGLTTCKNNATCTDLVNDFKCACQPGWTGKQCEVDINECDSSPCKHSSTCVDKINDYTCKCRPNFRGKNCDVILTNCSDSNPCVNGATACSFDGKIFKCTCTTGFTGPLCANETGVNLNGNGYWSILQSNLGSVASTGGLGFKLTLSFATTLLDGWLVGVYFKVGNAVEVYLEKGAIKGGPVGEMKTVTPGSNLYNDGKWWTLVIHVNASNWKLTVGSAHLNGIFKSVTNREIASVLIGGNLNKPTISKYTGCIRDVIADGQSLVASSGLVGDAVKGTCKRKPVCEVNSCNRLGKCVDKWTVKKCECLRQYYGDNCESEIKPFSFGAVAAASKNTTRTRRSVNSHYAYSDVAGTFDQSSPFSFLIRTRQQKGFVALVTDHHGSSTATLVIFIKDGKLTLKSLSTGTTFQSDVLNDGLWHEVIISKNQMLDNNKKLTFNNPLDTVKVSRVYVGGVDPSVLSDNTVYSDVGFDGCLQAIKLNDIILTSQIVPNHKTANMTFKDGVGVGSCPSNNPCKTSPCLYGGNCTDKWFEFQCSCRQGFTAKTCASYGCQVLNNCPIKAHCVDVPKKPGDTKCSKALTFNGKDSKATLKLDVVTNGYLSFDLQTRQNEALLFTSYDSPSNYFVVGIKDGKLTLAANYSGKPIVVQGGVINDGISHRVVAKYNGTTASLSVDNTTQTSPVNFLTADWLKLVSNKTLIIASDNSPFMKSIVSGTYFGALSIRQVGDQIPLDSQYTKTNVKDGWHSSNPCAPSSPCKNGNCVDIFNAYRCDCRPFYTKTHCNETNDVSCAFGTNLCNNGVCHNLNHTTAVTKQFSQNGKDYFKCNCSAGYQGYRCQSVTNECIPNNCRNGATCVDDHLSYTCSCTPGWAGKNCDVNKDDCSPNPCKNKGTCTDQINDFECKCFEGLYQGKRCTVDVDECKKDANACNKRGTCTNNDGGYTCACDSGYYGGKCQYTASQYCVKANPCRHGNCSVNGIQYSCTCVKGYTGTNCDQDYNECAMLKPCQHNGNCSDSHTNTSAPFTPGYKCKCTERYEGANCSSKINKCNNNPCRNGGTCVNGTYNAYTCMCTSQYTGAECMAQKQASGVSDDTIVIIVCVVVVVVVLIIAVLLLLCYFKRNSGQQGTYKPNAEEQTVGAVALDEIKKPKMERLI